MEGFQISMDWANRDLGSVIIGLVLGILTFIIGRWLARVLARFTARSMQRAEVDPLIIQFVKTLVYVGLLVAAVIAALDEAGIHTTSLTALLASAGLAIGLAVKDALANFASGVMILFNKPYRIDDYVEAAGTGGTVVAVSIFNTILRTADNIRVIVPNAQVTGGTIKNYSANDKRRVDLTVGIGYDDDIKHARDALVEIMTSHPLVLPDPIPTVDVLELADSSVNLAVRCWTATDAYWTVRSNLLEQLKLRFDELNINIPYPQQELLIRQLALSDN